MLKDIVTYLRFKHRRLIDSRSDSGFTIMELVIVLGIIGVLLTIVFLAIPRLTAAASNRSRDADVQTIFQALRDYATAHNTRLPDGTTHTGSPWASASAVFDYGDQYELGHYTDATFDVGGAPANALTAATSDYIGTKAGSANTHALGAVATTGANAGTHAAGTNSLPDTDNIHIFVGVKCPATNSSGEIAAANGTDYKANSFREGSKRQFIIVYRHDTENNPYRCVQG